MNESQSTRGARCALGLADGVATAIRPVGWTTTCRSCGSEELSEVISLGATPIANALVDAQSTASYDPTYPLGLVFCGSCSLVQLAFTLRADAIFSDDYPYFSSFSESLCRHAAAHVRDVLASSLLAEDSLVVEIASNDGYLLRGFVGEKIRILGVDPSPGPAAAAEAVGVPTLVGFFGAQFAKEIVDLHGHADVIFANNVLAHVDVLNDFVAGLAHLLDVDGVLYIENPYVRETVDRTQFDQIYHEHYSYFSCTAVDRLMRRHDLFLNDVVAFPELHGGTLRWIVGKTQSRTQRCRDYLEREERDGMLGVEYYQHFAESVQRCQSELVELLSALRNDGATIAAYGAAAKGATLLNSCGIGTDLIEYVVDLNPNKQGRLMPGCRLPVYPPEVLSVKRPDFLVVLAWNLIHEVRAQQSSYADAGGKFIVPVPRPQVL